MATLACKIDEVGHTIYLRSAEKQSSLFLPPFTMSWIWSFFSCWVECCGAYMFQAQIFISFWLCYSGWHPQELHSWDTSPLRYHSKNAPQHMAEVPPLLTRVFKETFNLWVKTPRSGLSLFVQAWHHCELDPCKENCLPGTARLRK